MDHHFSILNTVAICALMSVSAAAQQLPCEQGALFVNPAGAGVVANDGNDFKPAFRTPQLRAPSHVPRELYSDGNGVTVWGNVIYSRAWTDGEIPQVNAYSYSADRGLSVETVASDIYMFANGSGAFYDGKFHMVSKGYDTFLYCEYDVATWSINYQEKSPTKFLQLVATDCDYDPVTGLTYGCFWNPETKTYEFASVDYESRTHNTIAPMEIFSAIAINSKGVVYGIKESNGGLYIIDKTTGSQTFIGSTGVTPYLLQSAAFDRRNDVLYWAVRQVGSVAYLATVNTDNGAVKRLAYFPDGEQIACLYVPWTAPAEAPAAPSEYKAEPLASADAIDVSFTMPALTAAGNPLGADRLSYVLTLNGADVKTGQAAAGSVVTANIAAIQGYNTISIKVSNDAGQAVPVELRRWCGAETPMPVTDVTANIDEENNVTVSWNISDKGVHGAEIGAENITFDVVRQPGGVTVASAHTSTTLIDRLGNDHAGVHTYVITPRVGTMAGESVTSPEVLATGVYGVPFAEEFGSQASFDKFKVIDANNDGTTWFFNKTMALAEYLNGWLNPADDWLLTPEISLRAGQLYVLSFDCRGYDSYYAELLDIKAGVGDDPATYAEILPVTEIRNIDMERRSIVFAAPADGPTRIGLRCTSTLDAMYLLIDNISVTDGPAAGAPAAVDRLTITPDPAGQLSATITFDAPALCADRSSLSSITKIEVFRNDGDIVKSITDAAPGDALEVIDMQPVTGVNKYSVVATNAAGSSISATAEAYVGQDVPWDPAPANLVDNGSSYTLSWTAPPDYGSSARRGPVIVESLRYKVYNPDKSLLCDGVQGLSYDITGPVLTGPQGLQAFHVAAVSPAGEGRMTTSNTILTGKPYRLPFRESFASGTSPSTFWWTGGYNVFQLSTEMSYDNDGGCIRWKSNRFDKTSWFNSGKIDISPASTPEFSFAYRTLPGKQFKIKAYVSPDGGADILLGEVDFSTLSGEPQWQLATYSLSEYTDTRYVVVKLYSENAEPYVDGEDLLVYVDQIAVLDPQGINLAATGFSVPANVFVNQPATATVNVTNLGVKTSDYDVNLYAGGALIGTRRCAGLEPQASAQVSFGFTPAVNAGDEMVLHAEIDYPADRYIDDNSTENVAVRILRPAYATVSDLAATEDNGALVLSWSEPVQNSGTMVESFEDYIHKDTSFGQWMLIDNDGGDVYSNEIVDVGYYNVPLAYSVFNSIAAGVPEEDTDFYAAHTGTTSLIAIASQPTTIKNGDRNDDWLISPELSADVPHHISFWAKSVKGAKYGLETFEILYTKGYANDMKSFVSVDTYRAPQQWTQYTADLPEGTRFFAVRYTGEDLFMFMLDDIEYEVGKMDVLGYNVLRDGTKLAYVDANTTTWRDTSGIDLDTPHVYHVTVNYGNGESDLSNPAVFDPAGIIVLTDSILETPFDVYTPDGRCVRRQADSLDGLPRGIYVVGNRKVAIL